MQLDVFPDLNNDQLTQKVKSLLDAEPDKYLKNSLRGLIEERYLLFMLEQSQMMMKQLRTIYLINSSTILSLI